MMTKNPLTTLLSTSEGLGVLLFMMAQFAYVMTGMQSPQEANDIVWEALKWWLGARTVLKGVDATVGSGAGGTTKEMLTKVLDGLESKLGRSKDQ